MKFSRKHPTLASWRASRRLSKGYKDGSATRGRQRKVDPAKNTRRKEFGHRIRQLWAAIRAFFCQPLFRAGYKPGTGGDVMATGRLFAKRIRPDGSSVDYGLVSTKAVTDAGVAAIVDAFQGLFTLSNFNWHAAGTGSTAESQTETALVAEVETRESGTQGEGAGAHIYQTKATIDFTAARTIAEHGLFSASSAGTMLDRSQFADINVDNGDSIEFTYELTVPAGN